MDDLRSVRSEADRERGNFSTPRSRQRLRLRSTALRAVVSRDASWRGLRWARETPFLPRRWRRMLSAHSWGSFVRRDAVRRPHWRRRGARTPRRQGAAARTVASLRGNECETGVAVVGQPSSRRHCWRLTLRTDSGMGCGCHPTAPGGCVGRRRRSRVATHEAVGVRLGGLPARLGLTYGPVVSSSWLGCRYVAGSAPGHRGNLWPLFATSWSTQSRDVAATVKNKYKNQILILLNRGAESCPNGVKRRRRGIAKHSYAGGGDYRARTGSRSPPHCP